MVLSPLSAFCSSAPRSAVVSRCGSVPCNARASCSGIASTTGLTARDGASLSNASLFTVWTRTSQDTESGIHTAGMSASLGVGTGLAATLIRVPARTASMLATSAGSAPVTCTFTQSPFTFGLVAVQRVAASRRTGARSGAAATESVTPLLHPRASAATARTATTVSATNAATAANAMGARDTRRPLSPPNGR